jgi:hypothetical protein
MKSDPKAAERLYRNARREMWLVLFATFLALVWTVGYCWLYGYEHAPESWAVQQGLAEPRTSQNFQQIAGLPDWVFVGILLPWLLCTAFTIGMCLGIKDDDLGSDVEETQAHGH